MSTKLINHSGGDNMLDTVAYIARVSNPATQVVGENCEKLINYLISHNHWSPLEMVSLCLEINTTRDIARQLLRHRSFSFQEFSQRYADINTLGESIFRPARLQDVKNRQNSLEVPDNELLQTAWQTIQKEAASVSRALYNEALSLGIAKEQARAVMPEGLTPSKLYMNGTLRSWVHYIQLRSSKATQKEHRNIAISCANSIKTVFPMIVNFVEKEAE
jgi:thymidylate synthase (FAD)